MLDAPSIRRRENGDCCISAPSLRLADFCSIGWSGKVVAGNEGGAKR